MTSVSPSDVFKMSSHCLKRYANVFLCDDSENASYLRILSSESFQPISFTIGDRLHNEPYLHEAEKDFDSWCNELIIDQLQRISDSEEIEFKNIEKITSIIRNNLNNFLEYDIDGIKVQEKIWNQEFIDILRRIIGFSITGNPNENLQTHKAFNKLAKKLLPRVIDRFRQERFDLSTLLKLTIVSGLSGLDLKGSGSASSSFSELGILMESYFDMSLEESIQVYYGELKRRLNCPTPVFHWRRFQEQISADREKVKIAWFADDYIETFFDLLFIDNLLDRCPNIIITIIPRNDSYGNDASYSDVVDLLNLEVFNNLSSNKNKLRLSICRHGPSMGAINLRKLSTKVVDNIKEANFVIIKGCRAHEMIQGGLNKPSFSMYVVTRETSESVAGYDARECPLLFFYLSPGEYAFYGFKDRQSRTKTLAGDRKIYICRSTLEDHERRLKMNEPNDLVKELSELQTRLFKELSEPEVKEANQIAEKLLDMTKKTYDATCKEYERTRGEEPHELDKKAWNEFLELARTRVVSGLLGDSKRFLFLLDVGTGSGRDIKYISKIPDVKVIGIDISEGFIGILRELEQKGEIPPGSFRKADMRDLSCFPERYFDIIRHNATLLHLPVIGKGYMADLALVESNRVLKDNGLIYISVKEGDGLRFNGTEEEFGRRLFQFHTMASIKELICRNGFRIISAQKKPSSRGEKVRWLSIIAEKA